MSTIKSGIRRLVEFFFNFFIPYNLLIDKYSIIGRMSLSFSKGTLNKSNLKIKDTLSDSWEFRHLVKTEKTGLLIFYFHILIA